MNHYINLLEPEECHYLSAAESNPMYKLGGGAAALALIGGVFFYWQGLQSTIQTGEQLEHRWTQIEETVTEAETRADELRRLKKGRKTLLGWSASRFDWPLFLNYVADSIPSPKEKIQLTRLDIQETMLGLRNQRPSKDAADFHPVRRSSTVEIKGVLVSQLPEDVLGQFQRNLLKGPDATIDITSVDLADYYPLLDMEGRPTGQTQFTFTVTLKPREVLP